MINISKECAESIGQSIQNPNTFFANYCGYYYGNWVEKAFFYNYWNSRCYKECVEEPVDKTIYDPCPPGYTVPGYGIFSELKEDKWDKGWIFKGGIFFPASGSRTFGSGVTRYVGKYGLYWSTGATSCDCASWLGFDSNMNLFYRSHRSCGFSVRPCAVE